MADKLDAHEYTATVVCRVGREARARSAARASNRHAGRFMIGGGDANQSCTRHGVPCFERHCWRASWRWLSVVLESAVRGWGLSVLGGERGPRWGWRSRPGRGELYIEHGVGAAQPRPGRVRAAGPV